MQDAAKARELQAAEDRRLAEQLESERVATSLDPWAQAEDEWGQAMKKYNETEGEKLARKLHEETEAERKKREEIAKKDAELAKKLAAAEKSKK